ncbi:DNA cytosine methyltransferase [Psychrobacter piscatorii]|uniref:DNA cytosine methyltransferase n=1 Tax=Psychrobacter piscatorii TaxID=554343 RepID=UPI00191B36C5|nr:DNA cytosine methyltransferase [Psychrobacter piscatorii]
MYTAVDLFAGVGGMSLGFQMAGIEPKVGVEFDKSCIEALKHNFPSKRIIGEDVRKVKSEELLEGLDDEEIDVLIGGPPCQGFSLIGLRDPNDERSRLIFEFIRIAKDLQPKFLVIENVQGMLSAQKGEFIKELIKIIEEAGYTIRLPIKVLNAADYGVPQNRKRVFILAARNDLNIIPNYPEPTHSNIRESEKGLFPNLPKTPSVSEAIFDLIDIDKYDHLVDSDEVEYEKPAVTDYAKMMKGELADNPYANLYKNDWDSNICTGCRRTVHGEVLTKRFIETKQGDTVPVSRLYKLKEHDVANTLRAGTPRERGAYSAPRPVHPLLPRVISVREGARLQSFPDWHRFHKTKWHGFRQVGNAVPPLLALAVAKEVKKSLDIIKERK